MHRVAGDPDDHRRGLGVVTRGRDVEPAHVLPAVGPTGEAVLGDVVAVGLVHGDQPGVPTVEAVDDTVAPFAGAEMLTLGPAVSGAPRPVSEK